MMMMTTKNRIPNSMNNLVTARLATSPNLPPITAFGYEYVVAGNGLFIRAEDSRINACIPVSDVSLRGLACLIPSVTLKTPRISAAWLWSVYHSARHHLPNEVHYQFHYETEWSVVKPIQSATPTSVEFVETGAPVIDLHSHAVMPPFFSDTDNADEQGLRFYCVIGYLDTKPQLLCRVGVYGHHWPIAPSLIFDGLGPFTESTTK